MGTGGAAEPQTIEDQVRICEVEAPPFKESPRADVLARMFREAGLQNVRIDKEGHVLGDRAGATISQFEVPENLKTTFNVGRMGALR